ERVKSDIYLQALPLLNAHRVELLDHRRLQAQLAGLERKTARGGKDSVDHGRGAHDDIANSVLGALLLAADGPGDSMPVIFERAPLVPFGGASSVPSIVSKQPLGKPDAVESEWIREEMRKEGFADADIDAVWKDAGWKT